MNQTFGSLIVRAAMVFGIGTAVGKAASKMKCSEMDREQRRFVIAKPGGKRLSGVDAENHNEPPRPS
ncbi:MAG: hypothetical protein ACK4P3_06260 [Fimbriimonadaceae bacterium]